jgi:hypothetical protein
MQLLSIKFTVQALRQAHAVATMPSRATCLRFGHFLWLQVLPASGTCASLSMLLWACRHSRA